MKKIILLSWLGVALTIISCNSASSDNNEVPETHPAVSAPEINTSAGSATEQVQGLQSSSQEKINPPHGQPGHRCDIPEGAPLNSAPPDILGTPPSQMAHADHSHPSPSVQQVATPPVTAQPVTTAPGMNPPHGEPGHDCAIAVGAPLKK